MNCRDAREHQGSCQLSDWLLLHQAGLRSNPCQRVAVWRLSPGTRDQSSGRPSRGIHGYGVVAWNMECGGMWWHMFKCWAWSSWCIDAVEFDWPFFAVWSVVQNFSFEVAGNLVAAKLLFVAIFLFNPSQSYNSLDLLHVAIVPDDSPGISLGRWDVKKERMRLNGWACSKCSAPGISSFDMALRAQLLCSLLALSRQLPHSRMPLSSLKPIHCVRSRHSIGNFEVYAWYARWIILGISRGFR